MDTKIYIKNLEEAIKDFEDRADFERADAWIYQLELYKRGKWRLQKITYN